MFRPARVGDIELRAGQSPGQAPHLQISVPIIRTPGATQTDARAHLDQAQVRELRDMCEEWLR